MLVFVMVVVVCCPEWQPKHTLDEEVVDHEVFHVVKHVAASMVTFVSKSEPSQEMINCQCSGVPPPQG